jgi:hypothetical protein
MDVLRATVEEELARNGSVTDRAVWEYLNSVQRSVGLTVAEIRIPIQGVTPLRPRRWTGK